MERIVNSSYLVLARVVNATSWIIALPLKAIAWVIAWFRAVGYDPEQVTCPACGFTGDSGTGGKSCKISFVRVKEQQKAMIRHMCFRCGCDEIYSGLRYPAEKWLPEQSTDKIKEAMKRSVI